MYLFLLFLPPFSLHRRQSLHSTMYLFLQHLSSPSRHAFPCFTFHNVSISTQFAIVINHKNPALHSTMYLFLHFFVFLRQPLTALYIPQCIYFYSFIKHIDKVNVCFTFHNVSISTRFSLHHSQPPWFLYIPQCIYFYTATPRPDKATILPLHSTMYLFLLITRNPRGRYHAHFTFHNVSISTSRIDTLFFISSALHSTMYLFLQNVVFGSRFCMEALHSTMYLFLHCPVGEIKGTSILYIPQCIYFYVQLPLKSPVQYNSLHSTMYLFLQKLLHCPINLLCFTFHNVSISTMIANILTICVLTLHSTMYLFLRW